MRLLAIFGIIALAEMATFFWVESRIGLGWALAIAVATALIGSVLVRRAGISVLARFQERLREGVLPGRELSDGASILVAGAFLISPGFITDTLGFLLLIPAVRGLIHRFLSRRVTARFSSLASRHRPIRTEWHANTGVYEGEIIDVEPEEPEF